METYKQSDINFVNNLANIIFENELKILAEVKHSPEMYSVLLTEQNRKHTSVPLNDEIIISIFNELKDNETFIKETYHILSKEELTEQEKNVITNHILTEGLGRLVKKLVKWLFGKAGGAAPKVPVIRTPGPNGKWIHLEGPRRPFKPGVNYEPRPSGPGLPWPEKWIGPIPKPLADQFPLPKIPPVQ
jgi:hypothetical protein